MLLFFFFNDTATTEIYTLSLHDALPIYRMIWTWNSNLFFSHVSSFVSARSLSSDRTFFRLLGPLCRRDGPQLSNAEQQPLLDRKSTRLNSSHLVISYAVFCLKKKKHTHS